MIGMSRRERLSLLERPVPPGFELRVLLIAPLGERPYRDAEWRDALVVVEQGAVELESYDGSLWPFASGAVLWLAGLSLRALHNPWEEVALLAAVSRRQRPSQGAMSVPDPQGLTLDKFVTKTHRRTPT
jgi:hypothetical protein